MTTQSRRDFLKASGATAVGAATGSLLQGCATEPVAPSKPIGRVIVAGVGFLTAHDRRMALISLLVLLVVLASIVAAVGTGS